MRCAMTGREYTEFSDVMWDDGEWISWDWINQQIHKQDLQSEYPEATPELVDVFEGLVGIASEYKAITGNYLQVWGEMGELYAEIKFGVKRHPPNTQGSDGKLGNDYVEVKTISPEKSEHRVQVKRSGNFNKLLVVKISENFEFDARMVPRSALGKGQGKVAEYSWKESQSQSLPSKDGI
jgi:hypothetical protein